MRSKYLEEKTWVVNLEDFEKTKFDLFFKNRIKPFIVFLYNKYIKDLNLIENYDHKLVKTNYFDSFIFESSSINKSKLYCVESERTYEI
jgi:hypothetical protein